MPKKYVKNNYVESFVNNELKTRYKKLSALRNYGTPFPNDFRRNYTSEKLYCKFGTKDRQELKRLNIKVSVAGRMMACRLMGKASFVTLQDSGGIIQLYVSCNNLQEGEYNEHFKKWDLGDILGAKGELFKTKTGELSIRCTELRLLTKSLRPIPEKFHGLQDKETRYRQRYLDLISNEKSRNVFKIRSRILTEVRNFMEKLDFMEVETPMMQSIPGGASANPFTTYNKALDIDMYLRIAPELYLKRLVVGGFDRIFEINRSFRNEGFSVCHNPEFTMMELYMAYADYQDLMNLTELMFRTISQNVLGTTKIPYGNNIFDFSKSFEKLTMHEAIKKYYPKINSSDLNNLDIIKTIAKNIGIKINKNWKIGHLIFEIFEEKIQSNLIQPTFITEYPIEVSPLARRNNKNLEITDRFELFIGGREIANGFSELNDVEDQVNRFKDQAKSIKADFSDEDEFIFDKDYLIALEHGLPPTAGIGIGIDRLVMIFTNSRTIRDVILFPTMRPIKHIN